MNQNMLNAVELLSMEKDVPDVVVFEALEEALASATKQNCAADADIRVCIDRSAGDWTTRRCWTVVEDADFMMPDCEITPEDVRERELSLATGECLEVAMENVASLRKAAQATKHVLVHKVRQAERAKIIERYSGLEGRLLRGTVKRMTRDNLIVDLGDGAEGLLPKDKLIRFEVFHVGDSVRAMLESVLPEDRGPQLLLSRTASGMLYALFRIEVPEIADGIIEIRGGARIPGTRAKLAVKTNDRRIDPVGACVGMRGARVQAVSYELNGERVDIVEWNEDPAEFVMNALSPAVIESIDVDEEARSMEIAVKPDNLAQVIGRSGQNIRLASVLTGWALNALDAEESAQRQSDDIERVANMFSENLGIDRELARLLYEEGFDTLESVAYTPVEEMTQLKGIDQQTAETLCSAANDAVLLQALGGGAGGEGSAADDLMHVEGMDEELKAQLIAHGIAGADALADAAADDLIAHGIDGMDAARAQALIMAARGPEWLAQMEAELLDEPSDPPDASEADLTDQPQA